MRNLACILALLIAGEVLAQEKAASPAAPAKAKALVKPAFKHKFLPLKRSPSKASPKPAPAPALRKSACDGEPAMMKAQFVTGEWLSYTVEVKGIYAGRLVLEVKGRQNGDKGNITVLARGGTNTFFSKIQGVKGSLESTISASTLGSTGFVRQMNFDEIKISEDVKVSGSDKTLKADYEKTGMKQKHTYRLEGSIQDPISLLYRLRATELRKGDSLCFDIYGLNVFWKVSGVVAGEQGVWTKAGYFNAIKLTGEARMLGGAGKRYNVSLWLSADEKRIPLKIESVTELGAVEVSLEKMLGVNLAASRSGK